ncbi:hypothetical protein NMY22_g9057 [Coprinellus aureogranulatus]|nr:hypothetical protein NMY22_g9057 [Coprinellus aureogranulatus]
MSPGLDSIANLHGGAYALRVPFGRIATTAPRPEDTSALAETRADLITNIHRILEAEALQLPGEGQRDAETLC